MNAKMALVSWLAENVRFSDGLANGRMEDILRIFYRISLVPLRISRCNQRALGGNDASSGSHYRGRENASRCIKKKLRQLSTIKGGSRRPEKSLKAWIMMMIAAGLMRAGVAEKREKLKVALKS